MVFGPDAASVLLTATLIGGPAITFCIKMLLLIGVVNPLFGYIVLIMGLVLTVLVGSCNVSSACCKLRLLLISKG